MSVLNERKVGDIESLIVKYSIRKNYHPRMLKKGLDENRLLKNITFYSSVNNDDFIVEYFLRNKDKIYNHVFFKNNNDKVVDFVINNQNIMNLYTFCLNTNDKAVDWCINRFYFIMDETKDPNDCVPETFSLNTNDKAVEWLINHKKYIHQPYFSENTNIKAINYNISKKEKISKFSSSDEAAEYILSSLNSSSKLFYFDHIFGNTNTKIINFLIDNKLIQTCCRWFSQNTNDKAVEWLIKNPDKIDFEIFSENTNDKAVEWLIEHPNRIISSNFSQNSNDKAVEWLIRNPEYINYLELSLNKNISVIDFEKVKILIRKINIFH